MSLQLPLALNEGVFLLPVAELPEEVRSRLDAEEGDFALTRPQGRSGSKILDKDAAELVRRFKTPRTLIEAVILWSRLRGEDPEQALAGAMPLIKGLLASGFLVRVGEDDATPATSEALSASFSVGQNLLGGTVVEVLQVLEDTELFLIARPPGRLAVIKIERRRQGDATSAVRALLAQEAHALLLLDGEGSAPRLAVAGEVEGRSFLDMEFIPGIDLERAGERARQAGRREILSLALAVVRAYAGLHERGVLHGDVHPRNLLVDRAGCVRLVDFGFAVVPGRALPPAGRGGIAFYYEPELARAYLTRNPPPPSSPAGEQYAVAVMLYQVATGSFPRDYALGREEMLREIAELPPLSLRERGAEPWPELEAVLARALAKDPEARYPSLAELAAALEALPSSEPGAAPPRVSLWSARALAAADLGGTWEVLSELPAPRASINYGAAGVALGLLAIGQAQGTARPLALAGHWLRRADRDLGTSEGFFNAEIDITPEMVGAASPYHSPAGLHAVAALIARARGDHGSQAQATAAFVAASKEGHNGLDLTLGKSATLLGAAILLDATPGELTAEEANLRELGGSFLREIWEELATKPAISESEITYLGIAHGWAGFLYAALAWCAVSGDAIPADCTRRLDELAALARPRGRGLVWPWTLEGQGRDTTMPGWCNGSCGYVFLWTLAHQTCGDPRYLELARSAAWDTWDAADGSLSLCCGLAGRGYALLRFYRATGEPEWRERAEQLVRRAPLQGAEGEHPHSLWKGELGLAALEAALIRPEEARMPFFEVTGYRGRG